MAAPCSSTAEAIAVEISLTRPIVLVMLSIASAELAVASWMARTWPAISSVALAVWVARVFTSEATTAKPLPASPARAASIVALSASRLVWPAMSLIRRTTSPIFCAASARPCDLAVGLVRLLAPPRRRCGRFGHLAGDLADRGREFLGRRGDGLHVLRRSASEAAATAVAWREVSLGGRGHRLGGRLHLGRGGGDAVDHAADRALEAIGEVEHRLAALGLGAAPSSLPARRAAVSASIMLSLKTWTASAMSPISSLRPRAGISTEVSPLASVPMAPVICAVGARDGAGQHEGDHDRDQDRGQRRR